jgi:probable HAF family extracellular repeat protein
MNEESIWLLDRVRDVARHSVRSIFRGPVFVTQTRFSSLHFKESAMKRFLLLRSVLMLFAMACWDALPASAQTMAGLGYLPGASSSSASAISADGSTIVGESRSEPFIWKRATGMIGLGHPPGNWLTFASDVSADGSTVVGWGINQAGYVNSFVWTAATGMRGLTWDSYPYVYATGVSADGSTVVGFSSGPESGEAFVWTAESGMMGLGNFPGGRNSAATGISADGSIIVGNGVNDQGYYEAFIWTAPTGMIGLGTLHGDQTPQSLDSFANGVSADGSTVVGLSYGEGYADAFVWTAAAGMIPLGMLPGAPYFESAATGVSGDGSTVVGVTVGQAFVWTAVTGMVGLGYLPDGGYSHASGVSADGSTIVGVARNSSGNFEAFILELIPDPADLINALIDQVAALNVKRGIDNSLDAKLDAALDAFEDSVVNNDVAVVNSLNAFINAVNAQRGKAISSVDADALILGARKIIALLE